MPSSSRSKAKPLIAKTRQLADPDQVVEALWRGSYFGAKEAAKTQLKAFLSRRKIRDALRFAEKYDFSDKELEEHRRFMVEQHRRPGAPVRTVNWFVPVFQHAFYGGVYTILRFADYFQRRGLRNRILIYDQPTASAEEVRSKILAAFPGLKEAEVLIVPEDQNPEGFPPSDASIATLWNSAYLVMKTRNTGAKYYFIQDYEPLFYPAGTMYGLAEATYRFGLHGIVNTPGLCDVYKSEYKAPADSFIPSVDRKIFHPPRADERKTEPFRVFFYGRPSVDRNAFELGLSALVKFKRCHGDAVEIVIAGEKVHPSVLRAYPEVRTLGLLRFEETGDLYRSCHAGLSLMFTKHPSYLPFELMACGAVVVANRNSANTWLLKHGENCLVAEPSATCLADQLTRLFEDRSLLQRLSKASAETSAACDWDSQLEKIYSLIAPGKSPTAARSMPA